MEESRGIPLSIEKFGGYTKTKVKVVIERRGKAIAKQYGERGEALRDIRGVEGRCISVLNTYNGPMDYSKKLKLRFRVGDLALPERREIHQ